MTVKELRELGKNKLRPTSVSIDVCLLEVDVLLGHVLGMTRAMLLAHSSDEVLENQQKEIGDLFNRRQLGEPVAYLTGTKEFFGLDFLVTPDVLIPRPETELLVEKVLEEIVTPPPFTLVDICTGSGAIVIAVLSSLRRQKGLESLQGATVVATDLSQGAIEVARNNAAQHKLSEQITFVETNLLDKIELPQAGAHEVIVSNPPYVPFSEELPRDVDKFEPQLALRAGKEGLDIIKQIIEKVSPRVKKGAVLLLEIGLNQHPAVECLAQEQGLKAQSFPDLAGIERVIKIIGI